MFAIGLYTLQLCMFVFGPQAPSNIKALGSLNDQVSLCQSDLCFTHIQVRYLVFSCKFSRFTIIDTTIVFEVIFFC